MSSEVHVPVGQSGWLKPVFAWVREFLHLQYFDRLPCNVYGEVPRPWGRPPPCHKITASGAHRPFQATFSSWKPVSL